MSKTDIAAGERWSQELASELEASNFGIISVTEENLSEPWILFEAGSLAKSLQESKVIPLLLNLELSDIGGPLAQSQAKMAEKDGVEDIITSINKSATSPVDAARGEQLFGLAWPKLQADIEKIPAPASAAPKRPLPDVLEDLVASIRSFDSRLERVEEVADEGRGPRSRRYRRMFHPMMFEEMSDMIGRGPDDPIGLLMLASFFREDFPPLYEVAMEAYRASCTEDWPVVYDALHRLRRIADFMAHGRMREFYDIGGKEMHMMLRELPRMIDYMHHMFCVPEYVPEFEPPEIKPIPAKKKPTSKKEP